MDPRPGVGDSRRLCALCHFHFWRLPRIFYLGQVQDLVPDFSVHPRRMETASISMKPEKVVVSGNRYLIDYQAEKKELLFTPLVWTEDNRAPEVPVLNPEMDPSRTASGRPVFAICWNCFCVTRGFMAHRNTMKFPRPVITSFDCLYEGLYHQWGKTCGGCAYGDLRWQLSWPHHSYRGPFVAYDRWERAVLSDLYKDRETSETSNDWKWLVANPYRPIPPLPGLLLKHLHAVEKTDENDAVAPLSHLLVPASQKQSYLPVLPNEILDLITRDLDPMSIFALRRSCRSLARSIQLDQKFWYRQLVSNLLFGFFFDFDSMKVMEETRRWSERRQMLPPHWDWKRLVRDLAQFASFQNGGIMDDAPGAFRNRRRLWRILEGAEESYAQSLQNPTTAVKPIIISDGLDFNTAEAIATY